MRSRLLNSRIARVLCQVADDRVSRVMVETVVVAVFAINTLTIEQGKMLWQVNLVALFAFTAATFFRYGVVRGRNAVYRRFNELGGNIPSGVTMDRNDETGAVTAMVQKQNGDIMVIPIPEEIDNAHDAMDYILRQSFGMTEDD